MNYIMRGFQALKGSFFSGIFLYLAIFALMYLIKKQRTLSMKCIFEALFCVYCVTVLHLTGIFTLRYSLKGPFSYNLVPFVGSSIVPILLNFALFFPLGFLLPFLFPSCRENWKKVTAICALVSFSIELLQLFGGRYAEVEDVLVNTLGGFSGCIIYTCVHGWKINRKKAVISPASLCLALTLCFAGIYVVGDNEQPLPDGLSALEGVIAQINVYSNGESCGIDVDSYIYHTFSSQISNCGGHLLEIQESSNGEIWNDADCFLEVLYTSPQTITFVNAKDFSIGNADRLLYNADRNILYWGNSDYQYALDYTKMDANLQPYREEILKGYEELPALIRDCFQS